MALFCSASSTSTSRTRTRSSRRTSRSTSRYLPLAAALPLVSRSRSYAYLWLHLYGLVPPLSQNMFKNFKVDSFDEMSLGGNMLKSDWLQNRLRWNAGAPQQQPKRDLLFKG